MQNKAKPSKRLPTNGAFMSKSMNDWLYAYLQSISYVDCNGVTFCYPKDVNLTRIAEELHPKVINPKEEFREIEPLVSVSKSKISRDMQRLTNLGFLRRGEVVGLDGKPIKRAYILTVQKDNYFKMIPLDTIRYLVSTVNVHCVRTYVYLLDKFEWKQKTGGVYAFTAKEIIQKCFNLQSITNNNEYFRVGCILDLLIKCELIKLKRSIRHFGEIQYQVWELEKVVKDIDYDEAMKKFMAKKR